MSSWTSGKLTIRSRIMLMLIVVSGLASLVLIAIGYINGKEAIREGVVNELTAIRSAKEYQINSYFRDMAHVVEILGTNNTIREALKEFKKGFRLIGREELQTDCNARLTDHYEWFLDKLGENLEVSSNLELYYPNSLEACYLQYEYIVENPNPPGDKHLLTDAADGSYYTSVHGKYHDYLTQVILKFGFYDIFLVDLETGGIVYTSYKETDYATNLYTGPYRESNLADLARQLRRDRDLNEAQLVDFRAYRPSYGAPAAFIGMPVVEGSETIGGLILQLPVDEINRITTGNYNWTEEGLGQTGETYLVGEDYLMRSVSRMFVEDTVGFKTMLDQIGVDEEQAERMYRMGTTINNQRVRTEAMEQAQRGQKGTEIIEGYQQIPVLSSFAPLKINGLNWFILSEITMAEADAPLVEFERDVFIALCVIILVVTFLAMYLANVFVRPLEKLASGVRELSEGHLEARIDMNRQDEFGELASRFNKMADNIEHQQQLIEKHSEESDRLLFNFLPETIANRIHQGETDIADTYPNVSLIAVDLVGFSELTERVGAKESILLLNNIIDAFDLAAEKHSVEKIRTIGDTYFASCGMFKPRLDHARRVFEFAQELKKLIIQYNINHKTELHLNFGLHTGSVTAGIVGHGKFSYDFWGRTVNELFFIKDLEQHEEILVSNSMYQILSDFYQFEPVAIDGSTLINFPVWRFAGNIAEAVE